MGFTWCLQNYQAKNDIVLNIKNKYDVVYEYLNKERVKPGFKTLKDKIIQPLTILLQSSGYFTLFFHPFHSQPSTFLSLKQASKIVS